ncbi:MAG: hypothetical protein M3Y56_11995, partial [Armatimonadota bacterium]|nr:hypothetical protein [Armatimonadota bacterium]
REAVSPVFGVRCSVFGVRCSVFGVRGRIGWMGDLPVNLADVYAAREWLGLMIQGPEVEV